MKNKITRLLISSVMLAGVLHAKPITEEEAKNVALNYAFQKLSKKSKTIMIKDFTVKSIIEDSKLLNKMFTTKQFSVDEPTMRLIKLEPKGWVLISGDDMVEPIIGYSLESSFDENSLPIQLEEMLESFAKNIKKKRANPKIKTDSSILKEWEELKKELSEYKETLSLLSKSNTTQKRSYWRLEKDVDLNTPTWSQGRFYNILTPTPGNFNGHAPTGCVATAMAELMRFNSWPNIGQGTNGYTPSNYPSQPQFVNFGETTYNWGSMPLNSLTSNNNAVATIMHHAGVSVNMNYNSGSSGAFSANVSNALENHFRYQTYGYQARGDYANIYEWYQMIKTDLRQGFPVYYRARTDSAGHGFILDGFDVDGNEFQVNWGWNGSSNGMYRLTNLNGYNNSQHAVLGIKPNNTNFRDGYENDNSWQTSTTMSVDGTITRQNNHSIDPANDTDWINFWNPTNQSVTIETLNSSGDTRMWLYNKYGNQIAYNDDGGTNYLSKITQTLASGTYYIKIDEYGNNDIISSYDIRIQ